MTIHQGLSGWGLGWGTRHFGYADWWPRLAVLITFYEPWTSFFLIAGMPGDAAVLVAQQGALWRG